MEAELLIELKEVAAAEEDPPGTDEFLTEDGEWQCTGCGACCEDIRWCLPTWMVPGTTKCRYLTDDYQCAIYENRPWVCRMHNFPDAFKKPRIVARGCAHMRNSQYGYPGLAKKS